MTDYELYLLGGLIGGSLLFGYLRFVVPVSGKVNPSDIFKDMAHIWVGILIGAALVLGGWWWLSPVALTILEVVAFIVRRK